MQQRTNLTDAQSMFMLDCESRGFAPKTIEFYSNRLGVFLRHCDGAGAATVADLAAPLIRTFLATLQKRQRAGELSSSTVHSYARAIRTFCYFLVREELLDVSPFAKVKMPKLESKVLPALTAEEVQAVLKACTCERDKAILHVMLDTGVRAGELCALDVGDVDGAGAVTVRRGKGAKGRVTYIGARTRKQLLRYFALERGGRPAPTEPLFVAQRGGERLTYWGVAQVMKRLRIRSGVATLAPHALRRTMAIHSLRNGMNVYTLARMLGHADIQVLKQYLDIVQADVKTAARAAGVVDNL